MKQMSEQNEYAVNVVCGNCIYKDYTELFEQSRNKEKVTDKAAMLVLKIEKKNTKLLMNVPDKASITLAERVLFCL